VSLREAFFFPHCYEYYVNAFSIKRIYVRTVFDFVKGYRSIQSLFYVILYTLPLNRFANANIRATQFASPEECERADLSARPRDDSRGLIIASNMKIRLCLNDHPSTLFFERLCVHPVPSTFELAKVLLK